MASPPRLSLTVLRLSLLLAAGCSGAGSPPAEPPPCSAEADPDRNRCEELAVRAAVACNGQSDRTGMFERYGKLCASERANVLASGLTCLVEQSQGSCRTFSDPSGAGSARGARSARGRVSPAKCHMGAGVPGAG